MSAKTDQMKVAIDEFWRVNHYPPTIRALGDSVGIKSTSLVHHYMLMLLVEDSNYRKIGYGHIIPKWVDRLFEAHNEKEV
jgi:hypothetical protein